MDEREFQDEVDDIFDAIEDALDALDDDLDIDSAGGVLTVTLPNASSVIFSRQPASREIWIAARSGGFHLHKADDTWFCAVTQESLSGITSRVFSEQLGREVSLSIE